MAANTPDIELKQLFDNLGYTQKKIAEITNIVPSHLSEIISGKKPFTIPIAAKLLDILTPQQVENLIKHQLTIERFAIETDKCANKDTNTKTISDYDNIISVKTLCNRLNIKSEDDEEKLSLLQNIYKLPSYESLSATSSGFFRKSAATGLDTRMILTWILLAKDEARKVELSGVYNKEKIPELSQKLRIILNENHDTILRIGKEFSNYGIRFCIVEKTSKASIEGYSFLENNIPSIVLTMRYNRIDNLAFNVMHELGHIFLHLNNDMPENVSIEKYDTQNIKEQQADKYANDVLIPEYLWMTAPKNLNNPFATSKLLTQWSKIHHINKWIALGRFSHETGLYKIKNDESRYIN